MINYKLLTPGPLTTTDSVKKEMMNDHCTWDRDYKNITQNIRKELLSLAKVSENEYTVVLMQGSGTFGVESVLTSVVGEGEKLLIISNGSYGERMVQIAEYSGFYFIVCKKKELYKCNGKARSLSLDLYGQWKEMDKDGKWRFTSPKHVVLAFARALKELKLEGGVSVREKRYRENNKLLR